MNKYIPIARKVVAGNFGYDNLVAFGNLNIRHEKNRPYSGRLKADQDILFVDESQRPRPYSCPLFVCEQPGMIVRWT
jgi:hypothetical protein